MDDNRPNPEPYPGERGPDPRPESETRPAAGPTSGFDFNNPTIISLLYLSSFFLGITSIVGVVLAYVWKGEAKSAWEASHYEYLINTFWIGLVGAVIGVVLIIALVGLIILPLVAALVIVRCVMSMVNAQKHQPMPNPGTFLI